MWVSCFNILHFVFSNSHQCCCCFRCQMPLIMPGGTPALECKRQSIVWLVHSPSLCFYPCSSIFTTFLFRIDSAWLCDRTPFCPGSLLMMLVLSAIVLGLTAHRLGWLWLSPSTSWTLIKRHDYVCNLEIELMLVSLSSFSDIEKLIFLPFQIVAALIVDWCQLIPFLFASLVFGGSLFVVCYHAPLRMAALLFVLCLAFVLMAAIGRWMFIFVLFFLSFGFSTSCVILSSFLVVWSSSISLWVFLCVSIMTFFISVIVSWYA